MDASYTPLLAIGGGEGQHAAQATKVVVWGGIAPTGFQAHVTTVSGQPLMPRISTTTRSFNLKETVQDSIFAIENGAEFFENRRDPHPKVMQLAKLTLRS